MEVNATGFFATVRAFGDAMAQQKSGSIVNISSIYGMVGSNLSLYEGTKMSVAPDYFFHKGGMLNLTRYLGSHYGHQGVRVNVVSPGGIYNPDAPQAPEFIERYNRITMLGRMAEAREVAGAVIFLLKPNPSPATKPVRCARTSTCCPPAPYRPSTESPAANGTKGARQR